MRTTETLTHEDHDRRVVIQRARDTPSPRQLKQPASRLIQLYHKHQVGDEQMGRCDLAATADRLRSTRAVVINVWQPTDGPLRLRSCATPPAGWEPAGIGIANPDAAGSMSRTEIEAAIGREIEELDQWLAGAVYHASLETRTGETDPWTPASSLGYFYGDNHAQSGLYDAAGVPGGPDNLKAQGWRREERPQAMMKP